MYIKQCCPSFQPHQHQKGWWHVEYLDHCCYFPILVGYSSSEHSLEGWSVECSFLQGKYFSNAVRKDSQPHSLYSMKLSFTNEAKIKIFTGQRKPKVFVTTDPCCKMTKGKIFKQKRYNGKSSRASRRTKN